MPAIHVNFEGDGAWPDLQGPDAPELIHILSDWHLAVLENGMASGLPSLALRFDLPDGRVMIAETSLAVWAAATAALRGRYPHLVR
jgi:hypothetical protein